MNLIHSKSRTDRLYYPLFLDISDKPCLVVGGGKTAERKVRILLKFNGAVRVVSPAISPVLEKLVEKGKISLIAREYTESDLDGGIALVFAATNNEVVNIRVRKDAAARNILVNVVDNPVLCDFIVPSIIKKDPILIAISTSGTAPLVSRKLRKELAGRITKNYARYARIVGDFRKFVISTVPNKRTRQAILREIARMDVNEVTQMGLGNLKNRFLELKR
ncbi:MAG: Siroheme synthase [Syntrophorhabdus sp. PtaU1.Bin050]|nr:MAG: Siroheme synthase [Syntrophorhabdus sp. PtaU1.Bin050]